MFTRPEVLDDGDVAHAVWTGWGLDAADIEYVPVGFGSHHWSVTAGGRRWFVTVDDLPARRRASDEPPAATLRRLTAALNVARALRDTGLDFVVAPELTRSGAVVHVLDERFVASCYAHVEGDHHAFGPYASPAERLAVVDRLAAVHTAPTDALVAALTDDFVIPYRDELVQAMVDLDRPWDAGPFGESARELLAAHADLLTQVLRKYDRLASTVAARTHRFVLTHGEPHPGNTIGTAVGVVLVDWDTALLAPPERDLWSLAAEDPSIIDQYETSTGIRVERHALELYRLTWDLTEIALYVDQFRRPHGDTEDTRVAWAGLECHLDPVRWSAPGS